MAHRSRLRGRVRHDVRLARGAIVQGALDFYHSDDMTFAASIAYYSLLSFFPFLLLMIVGLSSITLGTDGDSLLHLIARTLPAQFDFLTRHFPDLEQMRGKLSVAGLLLTLWASMGAFSSISSAINYAWGVEKRPSYLRNKLIAFFMLLAAGAMLVGAIAIGSAAQMSQAHWFVGALGHVPGLRWLQSLFVRNAPTPMFIIVVGLIYYFVPNAEVRLRDVWVGAVMAGLLWRGAFAGFAFYVRGFSRFSVHGSIAAVVAFMIWIFVSAVILLYGAEVSAAYARLRQHLPAERGVPAAQPREAPETHRTPL